MSSAFDDEIWSLVPEGAPPPARHLARFVRSLGPSQHALDLGCGDGRTSVLIETKELVLADVSDVALARAQARLPGTATVLLEPDRKLALEDNAFDLVVCTETIEHVRDVQLLLSEARRVLRPGGRLAVSTPWHGRILGLDVLVRGFERRFDPRSAHIRFFTMRSLTELLDALGFDLERAERHGTGLFVVATR